jgi:two-component system, NtrC family, response regulator AtoC
MAKPRRESAEAIEAPAIVVVEDEANLRELLRDILVSGGMVVTALGSCAEAERRLAVHAPDVLILDVKLPDGDGLELLSRLRANGLRAPAVIMTAHGTVDRAVQALRAGASDFLVKPFDNDRMRAAVAAALETGRRLEQIAIEAPAVVDGREAVPGLVGTSRALRDIAALLPRVAASDATVLIQGESGTGKELIARALHVTSPRMDGPLVSLNCAAIAPSLLESELFGFERGAFTGAHAQRRGFVEAAAGGTLFLDEIGDMSLEAQARLLRVLQEREVTRVGGRAPVKVDVRVVAATHCDLALAVAAKRFRQDLLYRLDVVRIRVPPLRERRDDIPGLIEHFLAKRASSHAVPAPRPDGAVLAAALAHSWPGNVRELENFVERAVVLGRFEAPAVEAVRPAADVTPVAQPAPPPAAVRPLREAVAEAERQTIVAALRHTGGNKAEAARLLGVSYKTLFNKLHEHGVQEDVRIE